MNWRAGREVDVSAPSGEEVEELYEGAGSSDG